MSPHGSPSSSSIGSSSSDFEFVPSLSPSRHILSPADELFYRGKLLPLQLPDRISMVRTLLLPTTTRFSSSETNTVTTSAAAASGNSRSSSSDATVSGAFVIFNECDSSRPSSVNEEDEFKRFTHRSTNHRSECDVDSQTRKSSKYFSLLRFYPTLGKEKSLETGHLAVRRISATAKEVVSKYWKKVKPLYERLSQSQGLNMKEEQGGVQGKKRFPHSFSSKANNQARRSRILSCPSSMKTSPNGSRVISRNGLIACGKHPDASSMEELESAIQGAIAHCKKSMMSDK